jgi:general secretion pathway protein E
MGVEPFLLSSSLLGVLAQRLVRKLCPDCRARTPRATGMQWAATHCSGTGYKGRTGVYELMVADDTVRSLIHSRARRERAHRRRRRGRPALDARRRRSAW